MKTPTQLFTFLTIALLGVGCASTATTKNTKALKITPTAGASGASYTTLTIMPFTVATNVTKAEPNFGENFAGNIVARMKSDYPDVFQQVRWNQNAHVPNEVILEGTIRKYKPGDAGVRFLIGFGAGAASFEGDMVLRDASTGEAVMKAPFDKLWAWGGMLGASKTIENITAETAVAITKTVALWKQGNLNNR